jgi:CRP-like cAMP-binding protein
MITAKNPPSTSNIKIASVLIPSEGLMNNTPPHKNFIAHEDCETLILDKEHLATLLKQNPKFETLFTRILAQHAP